MSELHDALSDSTIDHAAALTLLIQSRKVDVEAQDSKGRTLLHAAAGSGNTAAVQALLSRSADPNARNKHGSTPLHIAVSNGHHELAKILVAAGADPTLTNAQGREALYGAPEALLKEVLAAPQRNRSATEPWVKAQSVSGSSAPAPLSRPTAPKATGRAAISHDSNLTQRAAADQLRAEVSNSQS